MKPPIAQDVAEAVYWPVSLPVHVNIIELTPAQQCFALFQVAYGR